MESEPEITHADVLRGTRLVVALSDGRVLVFSLEELLDLNSALLGEPEKNEAER